MENQNQEIPQATSNYQWLKTLGIGFGIVSFGIAIGVIGYILGTKNSQTVVKNQQSANIPTLSQPSPTPVDETVNWKTYINTKHDYSFSYPSNWLILSPRGQDKGKCVNSTDNEDVIELTQKTLGYCGFVGDQLPNSEAEFTVWVLDEKPWDKKEILTTDVTGKDISQAIVIAGEKATKTPFTEKSELPNIQATRIYFNHSSKGYLMFLKQTDKKGNYDPIFDQILSTFQFTDQ